MKIVKKNVYYCEYCKKKGLSSGWMKEHEKHCTGNINRGCKMCDDYAGVTYSELTTKFKAQMKSKTVEDKWGTKWVELTQKPKLEDIFDACEGCPACVLTVLRACGLCSSFWEMDFSWKQERDKWWAGQRVNEAKAEMDHDIAQSLGL